MECACGSGQSWSTCCQPYLQHGKAAPTAEALMRSRYVAFVRRDAAYLYRTWAPSTRPSQASLRQLPVTQWLGLQIIRVEAGGVEDTAGVVEFIARWQDGHGVVQSMHEVSRFEREKGRWVYRSGDVNPQ